MSDDNKYEKPDLNGVGDGEGKLGEEDLTGVAGGNAPPQQPGTCRTGEGAEERCGQGNHYFG